MRDLGPPNSVADQFYEVHSQGSWQHTLLAVLPHILLSLMFALGLWTAPVAVVLVMAIAVTISVFGWRRGRPRWTYPWLGYCLMVPIISWGLALSAVGHGAWSIVTRGSLPMAIPIYVASLVYFALSLWLVIRFVSRAARPDWLMASIGFLPLPFLAYWFFFFYSAGVAQSVKRPMHEVDSSAAVVFLILAAATAFFFRIGRRLVRVALLLITAPSMTVLAWLSYQGGPGYMAVFAFSAVSLAVLFSPALFDLGENRRASARPVTPGRLLGRFFG